MPAAYSVDLRKRVLAAYKAGERTYEELAALFGVGRATVDRWIQLYRKTGSLTPRAHGGGTPPRIDEAGEQELITILEASPDLTLEETAQRYFERRGVRVPIPTLHRTLGRLGLTRKKKRSSPRSGKATPRNSSAGTSPASVSKKRPRS